MSCGCSLDSDVHTAETKVSSLGSSPRATSRPSRADASSGPGHGRFVTGTLLAGRYRLVALVGRGGMSEVYRAEDLKLGQTVALKFLPERLADHPKALELLLSEVRLTRQISHPDVCRVYDVGEAEGLHFLSMEYIDGEDLASLLRRIGRLPGELKDDVAAEREASQIDS